MVQVRTALRGTRWQVTVDGLRQACPGGGRAEAVAHGRRTAAALGGRHVVHEPDGRVVEAVVDYSRPDTPARPPFFG